MFAFIVLLIVAGACFYFYQRLTALEQEIRAEQARARAAAMTPEPPKSPGKETPDPVVEKVEPAPAPVEEVVETPAEPATLEDAILAEVAKNAGMKQTELYGLLGDTDKKQLQKIVKEMADSGRLKREKTGNSYLLYPA
jgi:hypothetical protein